LQKGGVGKTSLSVSVANELAKHGRTIIVDVDPQGNASSWMLTDSPANEFAAALFGRNDIAEIIKKTAVTNLEILPTFGLDGELKLYGENQLSREPFIFDDVLSELEKIGFAYVVFDMSPGIGMLEQAVLTAAKTVLTPMTPEIFSLDGIEIFTSELAKVKKTKRQAAEHSHIIVNAFDSRIAQHKEILSKIKELSGYNVFTIPVDPVFRKAQALNTTINTLHGSDNAKKETLDSLKQLVDTLI
jgi:chromosome partitioning protein